MPYNLKGTPIRQTNKQRQQHQPEDWGRLHELDCLSGHPMELSTPINFIHKINIHMPKIHAI